MENLDSNIKKALDASFWVGFVAGFSTGMVVLSAVLFFTL